MPIEIKELHIRVTVSDAPSAPERGGRIGGKARHAERKSGGHDKDEIVAECVDQVFRILQTEKER